MELWVTAVYGRVSVRFQAEGNRESSVEVGFFWERATCSSDDDVGSVVCRLHALLQRFLLDQLRQETCTTEGRLEQKPAENAGKKHKAT